MTKLLNIIAITIVFIFISFSLSLAGEEITITTYYPSPYGSYRELTWGNYPDSRGRLSADQGASIELGGSGATPYIDFLNKNTGDFDMRIILTGDDRLTITGGDVRVAGNIEAGGLIYVRQDQGGCITMTYGGNSGQLSCPSGYTFNPTLSGTPSASGGIIFCCR